MGKENKMLEINKIHQGDCLELLKKIPDDSIDLVVTSPPYNIGRNNMTKGKYSNIDDKMESDEYFYFLDNIIKECLRTTRYTFFNITPLSSTKDAVFKLIGKYHNKIKEIIIWNKDYGVPQMEGGVLNSAYEFIIVFSNNDGEKRKFYNINFSRGQVNNVMKFKKRMKEETQKEHGAIFPIEFPRKIIKLFSKEDGIIMDPFMSSGTTALACKQLKRNFIGMELNPEYIKIANKRLAQQTL
ncbi:hypothetical protein LCGC14_1506390 [marine sediment metagenome]|uniref:site-specific DNA-methyltransferase (cytosine-N(4)-specific) n=1 Tax=marine sediment metagenome TaxID=412755 RepID=A0A0F9J305_9ZZZZ